ncbi:imidazole glycerol phosphate synthase subunit HisH [Mobilicoccus pelagius]|uniref:Imidazole glycerol phosphate synthase subunit HisH n=1 Tax=Mobilicoccus pelagius NBRC 104925 TaxID=1089455 RepID=H5UPJ3_9MICO|nr:imidazole glycerol phosphate synthase subunit HisH [Mobilicoccus pelagius]GAB47651.1 imidazole glycerol phosphate synthase subunit HisH [Mobilicoccus pelagius NBRC 104925]
MNAPIPTLAAGEPTVPPVEGRPHVAVLDYGSGNLRSAVRMLERLGAEVELTSVRDRAIGADGLLVPGVGNFHACMEGLAAVEGPRIVDTRLAGGRPVLGICVGMQVMFETSAEPSTTPREGLAQWPGVVERLEADVVPHMGWNTVDVPEGSRLFEGVEDAHFYFVHSYAARTWSLDPKGPFEVVTPLVTWAEHGGPFVAAVENGPLTATQFHPEKSGEAGARLLRNWLLTL